MKKEKTLVLIICSLVLLLLLVLGYFAFSGYAIFKPKDSEKENLLNALPGNNSIGFVTSSKNLHPFVEYDANMDRYGCILDGAFKNQNTPGGGVYIVYNAGYIDDGQIWLYQRTSYSFLEEAAKINYWALLYKSFELKDTEICDYVVWRELLESSLNYSCEQFIANPELGLIQLGFEDYDGDGDVDYYDIYYMNYKCSCIEEPDDIVGYISAMEYDSNGLDVELTNRMEGIIPGGKGGNLEKSHIVKGRLALVKSYGAWLLPDFPLNSSSLVIQNFSIPPGQTQTIITNFKFSDYFNYSVEIGDIITIRLTLDPNQDGCSYDTSMSLEITDPNGTNQIRSNSGIEGFIKSLFSGALKEMKKY